MKEQEEFFSSNHTRLLNLAWTANILIKVVIVVFVVYAGLQLFQSVQSINYSNNFISSAQGLILNRPLDAFKQLMSISITLLQGFVCYAVLKGVSLGLNMIVETDVNYREKQDGHDE